ncbi:hypothetical protein SpCBS45565_g07619 [Spizellomyces sp. 'palustris']|nr:hypothetical protein SpCBS45565_g07619 [Spizellomyces sp. 'palustris']
MELFDPQQLADYEEDGMDLDNEADAEGEDEEDEEEDEIVKEVDVYFSQALADSLYLFQYPTRPHAFDEETRPSTGRIKPKTKRFELEIPLQTRSAFYNRERGEELGQGTDNAPIRGVFDYDDGTPAKLLDKQTLSSSILPSHANYMIGLIRNDELHLTPIATSLQLRPSLFYIDKISEKQAKRYEEDSLEANKRANPEYEEEAKVLSVVIKGPDDKDAIRKAAQAELQRKAEEEPWLPLSIHHSQSEESRLMVSKLYSLSPSDVDFVGTGKEYLDEINPSITAIRLDQQDVQLKQGFTLKEIGLLPLKDKMKALLMNGAFSTVMELLGDSFDERDALQALSQAAVLVRGTWIVRSELLYSGRALEARRWLLYMFQLSSHVSRSEFAEATRLPGAMATSMLSEIAVLEPSKGWSLKVGIDENFLMRYQALVMEQASVVQEEAVRAQQVLSSGATPSKGGNGVVMNGKSIAKDMPMELGTVDDQLKNFIGHLLSAHHLLSLDYITKAVYARAKESDVQGNLLVSATPQTIGEAVQELCTEIKGNWVRKVLNSPLVDPYRPIIMDLFRRQDIVQKKDAIEATRATLGKEVPLTTYMKIMHELATVKTSTGRWQLKESPVWKG